MIHKFGNLSYNFDTDSRAVNYHQPLAYFNGGECDHTPVMLKYWKIREGDIVIDVGAHIGSWTLPALAMGAQHVYAFEPNKNAVKILVKNLELNGWTDRVTIYQKALWHKREERLLYENGQTVITLDPFKVGMYYDTQLEDDYKVDCVPLDDFNIKPDWIKIDVEGAELAVLIGGKKTIEKYKPKIYVEVHSDVIKKVIPEFKAEYIVNWLPPYHVETIGAWENGSSFLLSQVDK